MQSEIICNFYYFDRRENNIVGKLRVSNHIAAHEIEDRWTREVKISPYIVHLFEVVRKKFGVPIMITSGYRTREYQAHLGEIGYPAAEISPHCQGAAFDMLFPIGIDKNEFANMWKWQSLDLGYKHCRIGRKKYNDTFLHVDIVYLLFEPFTTIPNPVPDRWKPGVMW